MLQSAACNRSFCNLQSSIPIMARVGIALGSNLGDCLCNLGAARDMLCKLMPDGVSCLQAPVYRSAPLDCPPDSPDFFNTVIEISYTGNPHQLLVQTAGIESLIGRPDSYRKNAPRVIDLDILYFGNETLNDGTLTIPHPEITRRRFVLQPLADIRPELVLPEDKLTIEQHLHQLDSGEQPLTLEQSDW
jgi:2-amino-4-hydroxy-6-hydroxymethyldihydropteridine diphosphokinase